MQTLLSVKKWRLLLTVLPLTAIFLATKIAFYKLGWQPWKLDFLTRSLFGSVTFIIAFLLSGTLRDYNTSADMPLQIVSSIETIQDANQMVAIVHSDYDAKPLKKALGNVLEKLIEWLESDQTSTDVETALDALNFHLADLMQLGLLPIVNRIQTEQGKIRLMIHRITSIRDNDFLGPAYAFLEFMLLGSMIVLLLIEPEQLGENLVISGFIFTFFTYLLLLIRDLDNPYHYMGKSSVDVDLSILQRTRDLFQKDLGID